VNPKEAFSVCIALKMLSIDGKQILFNSLSGLIEFSVIEIYESAFLVY
jgi:hypothetical protein